MTPADLNALLGIEYGLHVLLFVAGLMLAWSFVGVLRQAASGSGRRTLETR